MAVRLYAEAGILSPMHRKEMPTASKALVSRKSYIVEIVIAPTRCGLEALICRWPCLRCVLLRRATAVCSEVSLGAFAKKSLGNSVLLMELRHTFCFYYSLYLRIH